jgi:hypothetical protein
MADDTDQTDTDPRERMEAALREIRREGWKAAAIYAVVDAIAVLLAINLGVALLDPSWAPAAVDLPASAADRLAALPGVAGRASIAGSALLGVGAGLVVFVAEIVWRVRQPLIERFEAGNPSVAEALRTARDAVEDDADTEIARRLYTDVLEGLRGTSSLALVDLRRVGLTVVLVLVLSTAAIQAAVFEVTIGASGDAGVGNDTADESVEFGGLQNGQSVLGDPGPIQGGGENQTAQVESTRGSDEIEEPEEFPGTGPSAGGGTGGGVESQQAGFAQPEEIDDAELVREYNVRIRGEE